MRRKGLSSSKHTLSKWVHLKRKSGDKLLRVEADIDVDKLITALAKKAAKTKTGKVSMLKGIIKLAIAEVRD